MIAILDCGVGNLRSVQKALERVGAAAAVGDHPAGLDAAAGLLLPGIGAFGDAMYRLQARGLRARVLSHTERRKPLLGICPGMQRLFDESKERGRPPRYWATARVGGALPKGG